MRRGRCSSLICTVHAEYLFGCREPLHYFYSSIICRSMSLHTSVIKLFLAPTALHHARLPRARDNNLLYIWWRHTFSSTFICYGVTIKIQQLTYSVTPHWEGLLVWSWTSEVANEFKRDEAGAGKLANESWRAVLNRGATYFNSKKDISEMIFFFLIYFQKDHFVSDAKHSQRVSEIARAHRQNRWAYLLPNTVSRELSVCMMESVFVVYCD